MDRVETPTEELLRGIAKTLDRETAEVATEREAKLLAFLRCSVLDCYEAISGQDSG